MITFVAGSGQYDLLGDIYTFSAADSAGLLSCAVSREGLEDLADSRIDDDAPLALFQAHEPTVFGLAQTKYGQYGRNDSGALTLSTLDVVTMRRA